MAKIRYVGTTETPINLDQLDDLRTHLTSLAEHHEIDLKDVDLDMAGEVTKVGFDVEVKI